MTRVAQKVHDLEVWRVRDLRDLELRRIERLQARERPHLHSEFEIAFVEGRPQRLRYRGATHIAAPGTLLVIPPGEVHAHNGLDGRVKYRSFFPDLAALRDASSGDSGSPARTPAFHQVVIEDGDLARRISALHEALTRPGSLLARETSAVSAACLLVDRHGGSGMTDDRIIGDDIAIRRAQAYLHDCMTMNVSLAELCAVTRLPARTLVRAFARRVGMPPHAFHLQLRLNEARRLLAKGESPARVAGATGFVDQSHLTRHFRRVVGVTPSAYAVAVVG